MSKRFILLIDKGTKAESDAFLAAIKARKLGWWHWIADAWLFKNDHLSAEELRDLANQFYPTKNKIVFEFREDGTDTWAGYGPYKPERDMFKWIRKNWSSEQADGPS